MQTSPFTIRDAGRTINKVDVIADAYSRMKISGLTVDPTPEDLELALIRLEDMMAMWESRSITVNYNFEDEPDPNSDTNVKSGFKTAMATNLAVNLIPDFNQEVSPVLFSLASSALSSLSGNVALSRLNQTPYPRRQPIGSGNGRIWSRWARFYRDNASKPNVNNSYCMFQGDVNDYTEQFNAYLNNDDFEEIASFDIQVDSGLELVSSSLADSNQDVNYRIKAISQDNENSSFTSQVTIIITTTEGRINTRRIFFGVEQAKKGV